jgi:hypothetical protein
MSALPPSPLFTAELLADRKHNPSALLLDAGDGNPDLLLPLLGHPDFLSLTARFPCMAVADRIQPAVAEALQSAGCQLIDGTAIHRSDQLPAQDLPPQFKWIAGDWYLAPPAKPSGAQAASRALALQLVQLVSADADTHEIEAALRRDPALSYHLLRLVNSLGMGMSRQITSFSQAILILGRAQLRRWLNLMLFSSRAGDERSAMLLARVATRARAMELLAKSSGLDKSDQDAAFMAGMFSLLGVLFGMPLDDVLRPLKISAALQVALLQHEGDIGRLLALVEAGERRNLPAVIAALDSLSLPREEFNLITFQSHSWMLDVVRESAGGAHA